MRRLLLMFMLMTLPIPAYCAEADGQTSIAETEVLYGSFVEERHLSGFNAPVHSEGRFVVAPKYGLIWDSQKPFPAMTVITPAGLLQTANGSRLTYLSAQQMPFIHHLYHMLEGALVGNWQALDIDFVVSRSGSPTDWQVQLSPRSPDNPAMPFRSISVKGQHFVKTVTMLHADGDSETIVFSAQTLSKLPLSAADDSAFKSVHP